MAELAKSLEAQGHTPKAVADFLTRILFCMFAEDVGLLPERSFTELLESLSDDGAGFQELLEQLFREMETGTGKGISIVLRRKLLQFSGRLFTDHGALPVNALQLQLLRLAAKQNWRSVEPAIFGTLLERALDPRERHKLGAHYTPRAYVERLVLATVMEPLRSEWDHVRAAAITHARNDDLKQARAEVNAFHDHLCQVKVLDPACGSGNFLYVALEHMKRLEGELLDTAGQLGDSFKLELSTHTVDPHQFLGIELNPRAAAIAELVLWVGYLQWHFRNRGTHSLPPEPVLRKFDNIVCRDAVLAYDGLPVPAKDEHGKIITIWDRHSMKKDAVTGRDVPDESKRLPLYTYTNPRPAEWPKADFIVGNPPFIGGWLLRQTMGDGYVETLWKAYPNIPEKADFVMYWWEKAATAVRAGKANRFGLITTNSISQTFQRRVVEAHLTALPPLSLVFAIPDHPWVDTADGAAVRIAMTVGTVGKHTGQLLEVSAETQGSDGCSTVNFDTKTGFLHADLSVGANVTQTLPLKANDGICSPGVQLYGDGFIVSASEAQTLLERATSPPARNVIRSYVNGRDFMQESRGCFVIDFFGLEEDAARKLHPDAFQRVLTHVKPERDQNRRDSIKKLWWRFGWERPGLRKVIAGLPRFIATPETAKHRVFRFLDSDVLPDNMLTAIALDDAFYLGVLSSRIHVAYVLTAGGTLEDRPRYTKSRCFDPFPFPACSDELKARIRAIAEELDAHRKRVQAQHPELTLTGMYNVLEKLRAGKAANTPAPPALKPLTSVPPLPLGESRGEGDSSAPAPPKAPVGLTQKEKQIHDLGLVSVLRQLHDDLDAAVFAAYGWPPTLTDAEILERLVALNAERAKEEASGLIRWLRPEYQNPAGTRGMASRLVGTASQTSQQNLSLPEPPHPAPDGRALSPRAPWPKTLPDRVKAVSHLLSQATGPVTAEALAAAFKNARRQSVQEILETLCTMGQAHRGQTPGTYLP